MHISITARHCEISHRFRDRMTKETESLSKIWDRINSVEIEVVSSLQNAWGPLHERTGDDNPWCGPNAFEDDNILREEMNLFPYGLLGGVELVTI